MSNFVNDGTSLAGTKVDAKPATGPASQVMTAAEINTLVQAAYDLRGAITSLLSVNVKAKNALGDGVTDDTAALAALAATTDVSFPAGTYVVSDNLTFAGYVRMAKGAILQIASGKAVTFNGGFQAPISRAFSGSGTVAFSRVTIGFGYPEWWGAVTGGADCLAAFTAAEAALPLIMLQDGDYWISSTMKQITPGSRFVGTRLKKPNGTGTRVVLNSATLDCWHMGPDANPGSVNSFTGNCHLENVEISRSVAPNPAASAASGPHGVVVQYGIYAYLKNVWSTEHAVGFFFNGSVNVHLNDCFAFRSAAGGGVNPDFFRGFWANGNASIGLAGGNGSVYLTDCSASMGGAISSTGGSPIASYGFIADGAFADIFMLRPETSAVQYGTYVSGLGGNASASLRKGGNGDLHIINGIFDTFTYYGVYVDKLSEYAAIDIVGCYAAPGTSSATAVACYSVQASNASSSYGGLITLTNNQGICWPGTDCIGFYYLNCSGVIAHGNLASGAKRPIILDTVAGASIRDAINSPGETSTLGAVWLSGCARCVVVPVVNGGANLFAYGVNLTGAGNSNCTIDCTAIDPAAVSGGASNKLVINSVQITANGPTGTHIANGVGTTLVASNLSGTNTGDVTLAAVGSAPSANGASLSGQVVTLQPADGTHPGLVTSGTQTLGGAKTFASTVAASNLSGTNTGDVTLAAVGSTPGANGASLSGQALTLQPADGTNPGLVTSGTQTFGGAKTFAASPAAPNVLLGFSTTATAAGTTTLTVSSNHYQEFTGTTTQTVKLPDATTLVLGQSFTIVNKSTGLVTVNDNGSTAIAKLATGSRITVVCAAIGSAAGTWDPLLQTAIAAKAHAATTSIPNTDTATTVVNPTVDYDTHSAYNSSTGIFTCPVAGIYRVTGAFGGGTQSATAGQIATMRAFQNGASACAIGSMVIQVAATAFTITILGHSTELKCAAGDTLSVTLQIQAGFTAAVAATGSTATFACFSYVGPA